MPFQVSVCTRAELIVVCTLLYCYCYFLFLEERKCQASGIDHYTSAVQVGNMIGLESLSLGDYLDASQLPHTVSNLTRLTSLKLPNMHFLDER